MRGRAVVYGGEGGLELPICFNLTRAFISKHRTLTSSDKASYLDLPKLGRDYCARLWNIYFSFTQSNLELHYGASCAKVLIETVTENKKSAMLILIK